MTAGRDLTDDEFGETLRSFERTAFRLELQPAYAEPSETGLLAAFLRDEPLPPTTHPGFRQWYAQIAAQTRDGKRIARVRVQQDPPTDYQRFERYLDNWNIPAGETMRYLTWQQAHDIGLLPGAGPDDFWLLDDAKLIVMRFDADHRRTQNQLVTDPVSVAKARECRDLAVQHSVRAQIPVAAA